MSASIKTWTAIREAGWRYGLGLDFLRSRAESIYYGTAKPRRVESRHAARRQQMVHVDLPQSDNGEIRCLPDERRTTAWDYDGVNEMILADIPVRGRQRNAGAPRPHGFVYTLDRETGEVITAAKFVFTNWADRIDLRSGRPVENPAYVRNRAVVTRGICPSSTGGKDEPPGAFSPVTGWFYFANTNDCMDYEASRRTTSQGRRMWVRA